MHCVSLSAAVYNIDLVIKQLLISVIKSSSCLHKTVTYILQGSFFKFIYLLQGGKTFVIKNQADFARELLPLYYKHNNMASFIRQLNMYGFHKITSVENGGLRYEKDEIEFSHPCFMKGHAYLLEHIKRKIANPKSIVTSNESGEKVLLKPELMNKVLTDVKQMKGKQESLDAKFSAMKQENEALWREVAILRQKHIKQQQIVNNVSTFHIDYLK